MESNKNIVVEKSFDFAIRIVKLYKYLTDNKKEYILSKQVLKSGTSIGANISEAQQGQSKKRFPYQNEHSTKGMCRNKVLDKIATSNRLHWRKSNKINLNKLYGIGKNANKNRKNNKYSHRLIDNYLKQFSTFHFQFSIRKAFNFPLSTKNA